MANEGQKSRRIKMACDECHSRRVKCNGEVPCVGCHQSGISCTYLRPKNKRGGASYKQRANHLNRRRLKAAQRASSESSEATSASASASVPISYILNDMNHIWNIDNMEDSQIRYPILGPVMGSLSGILTSSEACDMLESYFVHSLWGNTQILRRSSFLTTDFSRLRKTKPALIYSMLCLAGALYVDHGAKVEILDIPRSSAVDQLFELCRTSLVTFHNLEEQATIDDVIGHLHLACILSSSKYQKKSIEWWSATYQLARQLRLNEENSLELSDEEKEVRRRVWWLLYCVDRHQALSVRKSLSFRDAECHELLHPCDEAIWNSDDPLPTGITNTDDCGIVYRVTNCSFFGFILPLMSILGEIIDMYNIQENDSTIDASAKRTLIEGHMDMYEQSLESSPVSSDESELFKCYSRHTLCTLRILCAGKWDPLDVLADVEASGLSKEVIYSAAMATIAASTINDIKRLDTRFQYIKLFFGLFVLQCSFPLLVVMKTFGTQSDENIIGGCEAILQAWATFSRSNDEIYHHPYWSSFASITNDIKESKVQPTTSPGVANKTMEDIHTKAREIMGIYRWNKTGHGVNP